MKLSVKSPLENKIKKPTKMGSSQKKVRTNFLKRQKSTLFSKVIHATKRYGKQVIKNILLSKVFHLLFKFFVGILIFSGFSYMLYSHFKVSFANDVIVSRSEIVDRVAKLTSLPVGNPDAIVRVEDPETLKKQNNFYENAKNGDYILMYPKLAIIFDLRNNTIVAIKKSE